MKWTRAGDRALFLNLGGVTSRQLHETAFALWQMVSPGAVIAGHSSLLLLFDDQAPEPPPAMAFAESVEFTTRQLVIPVSFHDEDAPDLPEILERLNISKRAFLDILLATRLEVRFLGFLPGFAYLDGLPRDWDFPRRPTSRSHVPKGSLGLAAGMAGFYPRESPGGWNLVGRSNLKFWDESRSEPALFRPGDVISLHEAPRSEAVRPGTPVRPSLPELETREALATCVTPGQRTMIVGQPDLERYQQGLACSGAFDAEAAMRANRSVGNHHAATVLECVMVGPELLFHSPSSVAWEGASIEWQLNDKPIDKPISGGVLEVDAGDRLRVGRLFAGFRGWLAFGGGGLEAPPPFLVAPAFLTARDSLFRRVSVPASSEFPTHNSQLESPDPRLIRVLTGPHEVAESELATLVDQEWIVTRSLDRVGIRLRPSSDAVTGSATLPSAGMQFGSVQLHPNGELVIMGPDHPITGGYLQPMTVLSGERWKLAQLKPWDRVSFRISDFGFRI